MANGFVVADVPGAIQRGRQFRQENLIRPTELARANQQVQLGQQQIAQGGQQFQLGEQRLQLGAQKLAAGQQEAKLKGVVNTAFQLKNTSPDRWGGILQAQIDRVDAQGGDSSQSRGILDLVNAGEFDKVSQATDQVLEMGVQRGIIEAPSAPKLSSLQQKVAAEGLDPLTAAGQARAREITQGSRTDPSLKPSDQAVLNKANEGQLQSSTFANRVRAANDTLANLEATEGFDPTSIQTAFFESIPGGNIALSSDEQKFAQAKRDFITAVLRKESGAAIGADEFANEDKKFFPQVGDKPAVLKQKAEGRKRAFESLRKQSKGVFDIQFGEKTGSLSKEEQAELKQLRAELGQ